MKSQLGNKINAYIFTPQQSYSDGFICDPSDLKCFIEIIWANDQYHFTPMVILKKAIITLQFII